MKNNAAKAIFAIVIRLVGIFILIQGIRMIGEGIYNYIDEHNQQDWVTTSAYVIDISSEYSHSTKRGNHVHYDITYQYEVDGKSYSDILYNRKRVMALGESVKIKYDPDAPENSTDIMKPSLNNLIVFLVFGMLMAALGFFMSGSWALIRKVRRHGQPEEEEILPTEEYVKSEEIKQNPRNSGKSIVLRLLLAATVVGIIMLSSRMFMGTHVTDTDRFIDIVGNKGYTTTDTTDELSQSWKVGSMLQEAASFNDGNIRIDFCVMDTADSASVLYNRMTLPMSDGETQEHSGITDQWYSGENDTLYAAKLRSGNIVLYISAKAEYKAEAIEIIDALGYGME